VACRVGKSHSVAYRQLLASEKYRSRSLMANGVIGSCRDMVIREKVDGEAGKVTISTEGLTVPLRGLGGRKLVLTVVSY